MADTVRPEDDSAVATVVKKNIRDVYKHRAAYMESASAYERLATTIADVFSRPLSVVLHGVFFLVWTLLNSHMFGLHAFDPFPFGLLTTIVSLEAIFLTLFVLLSQRHMQQLTDRQSELDLQVNLLAEHELTRVLVAVDLIAKKLEVELPEEEATEELKVNLPPHVLLQEIEKQEESRGR